MWCDVVRWDGMGRVGGVATASLLLLLLLSPARRLSSLSDAAAAEVEYGERTEGIGFERLDQLQELIVSPCQPAQAQLLERGRDLPPRHGWWRGC
jgi:hypothetical protein